MVGKDEPARPAAAIVRFHLGSTWIGLADQFADGKRRNAGIIRGSGLDLSRSVPPTMDRVSVDLDSSDAARIFPLSLAQQRLRGDPRAPIRCRSVPLRDHGEARAIFIGPVGPIQIPASSVSSSKALDLAREQAEKHREAIECRRQVM